MVSVGPYNKITDMQQMWNIPDLRGPAPEIVYPPKSLMGIIANHPELKAVCKMIKQANMDGRLADEQANLTVFLPSDVYVNERYPEGYVSRMGEGLAKRVLGASMLNRQIDRETMRSVVRGLFPCVDRSSHIQAFSTPCGCTCLNDLVMVKTWDIHASNGILHLCDGLLLPRTAWSDITGTCANQTCNGKVV